MKKQRYIILYEDDNTMVGINDTKFAICRKYGSQRNWFPVELSIMKKLIDEQFLIDEIISRLDKSNKEKQDVI